MIYYKIHDGEKLLYTTYVTLEDAEIDFLKIPLEDHKIPHIIRYDDEDTEFVKPISVHIERRLKR